MGKSNDIDELLGDESEVEAKPAKKAAKKEEAKPAKKAAKKEEAKPAKKAAKKEEAKPAKKAAKKEEAKPAKKAREPITFEEGERDALKKRIKQIVKKPINTKDLAVKLDIPTRKLRVVLYSLWKAEEINLESGESPVMGMTVSPI